MSRSAKLAVRRSTNLSLDAELIAEAKLGGSQTNLVASHDKITDALDMLFQGF